MLRRFGRFLIKQGVVDVQHIVAALEIQRAERRSIADLAVDEGLMSAAQAQEIVDLTAGGVADDMFGEIAIHFGYLIDEQLDLLLMRQDAEVRRIGDVLVDLGVLDPDELEQHLAAYDEAVEKETRTASAPDTVPVTT